MRASTAAQPAASRLHPPLTPPVFLRLPPPLESPARTTCGLLRQRETPPSLEITSSWISIAYTRAAGMQRPPVPPAFVQTCLHHALIMGFNQLALTET